MRERFEVKTGCVDRPRRRAPPVSRITVLPPSSLFLFGAGRKRFGDRRPTQCPTISRRSFSPMRRSFGRLRSLPVRPARFFKSSAAPAVFRFAARIDGVDGDWKRAKRCGDLRETERRERPGATTAQIKTGPAWGLFLQFLIQRADRGARPAASGLPQPGSVTRQASGLRA